MNKKKSRGSFWVPILHVLDAQRNPIMQIKGPCCICDGPFCPRENAFNVINN